MHELIDNLREALDEERDEILNDADGEDRLHEIVDGLVPIYYGELAHLLAQDTSLGFVDDIGLVANAQIQQQKTLEYCDAKQDVNAFDIISVSVYEHLIAAAYTWLEDAKEAV
jgi:hypothetical protein